MIKVEKDKGWAFVVLFAACGIQLFTAIFTYGSGVMHLYLLDKYRKDDATTSVIGSLFVNLLSVFGIGVGLALLPALFAVGVNFEKHSGVAHGMCQAGLGIGMTLSGPFMEYLLSEYGLRGTYLLSGAIASHLIFFALLLRTPENTVDVLRRKENNVLKSSKKLLTTPFFMCVLIGAILWNMSYSAIMIQLTKYVVLNGVSQTAASFSFTVIGIGTIISRLVVGVAIGPGGLDPLMFNVALTACMGVVIGTFPFYISSNSGYIIFYGVLCMES